MHIELKLTFFDQLWVIYVNFISDNFKLLCRDPVHVSEIPQYQNNIKGLYSISYAVNCDPVPLCPIFKRKVIVGINYNIDAIQCQDDLTDE